MSGGTRSEGVGPLRSAIREDRSPYLRTSLVTVESRHPGRRPRYVAVRYSVQRTVPLASRFDTREECGHLHWLVGRAHRCAQKKWGDA